jgi:hypothetical protein
VHLKNPEVIVKLPEDCSIISILASEIEAANLPI